MRGTTSKQPVVAVIAPATLQIEGKTGVSAGVVPMTMVIAKLADLRSRYLRELMAARDKAKKNFLV